MRHEPTRQPPGPPFGRRSFSQTLRRDIIVATMVWLLLALTACGQVDNVKTPTQTLTATAANLAAPTVLPRPTVTRAQPTAAPPNTATPSPTPIVHVVQSGETLIAIALKYGVTVEAIQSANGIVDPSLLQVNQELFIPMGAESRSASADNLMSTPTSLPFAVEGLNCREQAVGSLWCLGEVVNSTPTSMENVQLRVTLHDGSGAVLMAGDVNAALDLIPSGQRAPFGVLFTSPPEGFDQFWATPIRAESSSEPVSRYAALEIKASEAAPVGSLFEVIGTVTNPGQSAATFVTVVVTTYDATGQVTGFRQARLPDAVAAGASVDFAISLMPYDGVPSTYTLAVQGRLANP